MHFMTKRSKRWWIFVLINTRADGNIFRVKKSHISLRCIFLDTLYRVSKKMLVKWRLRGILRSIFLLTLYVLNLSYCTANGQKLIINHFTSLHQQSLSLTWRHQCTPVFRSCTTMSWKVMSIDLVNRIVRLKKHVFTEWLFLHIDDITENINIWYIEEK